MIKSPWNVYPSYSKNGKPINYLVFLPGRDQDVKNLTSMYMRLSIPNATLIGLQPWKEWYPAPTGDNKQTVLKEIKYSVAEIDGVIKQIETNFNTKRENIGLIGFSAGGVMALQCGQLGIGAIVAHSAAIFDPENYKETTTPVFISYGENDQVFKLEERLSKMEKAVIEKAQRHAVAVDDGVHEISWTHAVDAKEFIEKHLIHKA